MLTQNQLVHALAGTQGLTIGKHQVGIDYGLFDTRLPSAVATSVASVRKNWRVLCRTFCTYSCFTVSGSGVCHRSCRVDHTFMQSVAAVLHAGFAASLG